MSQNESLKDQLKENYALIQSLSKSEDARKLSKLLSQSGTDVAQMASKGDTTQLQTMVQGLMKNPETAKLIERLNEKINESKK